jgi:hypothetical protein
MFAATKQAHASDRAQPSFALLLFHLPVLLVVIQLLAQNWAEIRADACL